MGQDCNQRKFGTRLYASIHPLRTGLFATETAFILLGLQSTALRLHEMRLTDITVLGLALCGEDACVSGERRGGAAVSYTSGPGDVSASPRVNPPC